MRIAFVALWLAAVGCGGDKNPASSTPPIQSYEGSWGGNYTITGCTQSGGVSLANICGALGNSAPYHFNFTQSQRSVTGSFTLGSVTFPSTGGTVNTDGSMQLQATSINSGITVIVTWNLTNSGNAIGGTVSQVWTSTSLSGQANVAGNITSAVKGASAKVPPVVAPQSVSDLVRAMNQPQHE